MVDHPARGPRWSSPAAAADTSHVEGSSLSLSSFSRLHRNVMAAVLAKVTAVICFLIILGKVAICTGGRPFRHSFSAITVNYEIAFDC